MTFLSDMEALEENEGGHSSNPEVRQNRTDENRQLDDRYGHISDVRRFVRSAQVTTEMKSWYLIRTSVGKIIATSAKPERSRFPPPP